MEPTPPQPNQDPNTPPQPAATEPEQRPMAVVFPQQTQTIINGKVINSAPVATADTASSSAEKKPSFFARHKAKSLLVPIIAVFILAFGTAAAYVGYYVPNKPENILSKSIENSLQEHQITTKGVLNLSSGGISSKFEYTIAINEDQHATNIKVKSTVSGVTIPVELISAKSNVYVKVGDLSSLKGIASAYLGDTQEAKQLEDKIIKTVTDQWIVVDSTLMKEIKLDCLASLPAPITPADIQAIKTSYQKAPFVTIASHSSDRINGRGAVKYLIKINDDQSSKLDLGNLSLVKSFNSCSKQARGSGLDLSTLKDGDTTPITVWVDKGTKRIVKYASQITAKDKGDSALEGDLTGTITYGAVSVSAPATSKPLLSLLNDLNLGGITNSFAAQSSATSTNAKDAERKTDINALLTQAEVFYTDNAYYPSFAQFNDPVWRAANMKGLDPNALKDPDGTSTQLAAKPAKHIYAYRPESEGCNNLTAKTMCVNYALTATLENGNVYVKQALNTPYNYKP
jgi:hypothetical protein